MAFQSSQRKQNAKFYNNSNPQPIDNSRSLTTTQSFSNNIQPTSSNQSISNNIHFSGGNQSFRRNIQLPGGNQSFSSNIQVSGSNQSFDNIVPSTMSSYDVVLPPNTQLTPSYDNQSFDTAGTTPSTSTPHVAAASSVTPVDHQCSTAPGLVPFVQTPGYRVVPHAEIDKMKRARSFALCQYRYHYNTRNFHKKLQLAPESSERVEIRKLLNNTKMGVAEFQRSLFRIFPDLACYKCHEILSAAFPGAAYRHRWLVIEENNLSKARILSHRAVTDQYKIEFKKLLGSCCSYSKLKSSYRNITVFQHMSLFDILITVYSTDFHRQFELYRQYGPFPDVGIRIAERFRLREYGLSCSAVDHINPNNQRLTEEQKFTVVGLLRQPTDIETIRKRLAELFVESFSARSSIDVLGETFGRMLSFCVEEKAKPGGDESQTKLFQLTDKMRDVVELSPVKKQKVRRNPIPVNLKKKRRKGVKTIGGIRAEDLFNMEQGEKIF